jgi:hypothetical protein
MQRRGAKEIKNIAVWAVMLALPQKCFVIGIETLAYELTVLD